VILLSLSLFFGGKALENLKGARGELPASKPPPSEARPAASAIPVPTRGTTPASAYRAVEEMNLFSPDRKPPVESVEPEPPEEETRQARVSGGRLELHGVIKSSGYETALITNPERKKSDDPEFLWIQTGDRVGEFEVAEVATDSVVFREGGRRLRVVLYDPDKTVQRRAVRSEVQPTVVTTESRKAPEAPAAESRPEPPREPQAPREYVNPFSSRPTRPKSP
jgi:hypothetical protein